MKILLALVALVALSVHAAEKVNTADCEMVMTGKRYYLNLCPANTVMIGANPLPGNPSSLQILCARYEIRCEAAQR